MVTFQCESWGISAKYYLIIIAFVLFIAAVCFLGATSYEKKMRDAFSKEIDVFLQEGDSPTASEDVTSYIESEGEEMSEIDEKLSENLFTTDFIVLLILAAIGGLQITYISSNHLFQSKQISCVMSHAIHSVPREFLERGHNLRGPGQKSYDDFWKLPSWTFRGQIGPQITGKCFDECYFCIIVVTFYH